MPGTAESGLEHFSYRIDSFEEMEKVVVDFLVMEYLEGETLRRSIAKGPPGCGGGDSLRDPDCRRTSTRRHRQGVVHRDLKPGNIMLTATGAKLLDFRPSQVSGARSGERDLVTAHAAKASHREGHHPRDVPVHGRPSSSKAKTPTPAPTSLRFGSMLFEMLTGQKAFQGKSQASLVAAILEREPPLITSLQPMSPAGPSTVSCGSVWPRTRTSGGRQPGI